MKAVTTLTVGQTKTTKPDKNNKKILVGFVCIC